MLRALSNMMCLLLLWLRSPLLSRSPRVLLNVVVVFGMVQSPLAVIDASVVAVFVVRCCPRIRLCVVVVLADTVTESSPLSQHRCGLVSAVVDLLVVLLLDVVALVVSSMSSCPVLCSSSW